MQPETRPISHEQLVAEVKGIYAGLVMVEAKCIEVNDKTALSSTSESPERLSNEQWQALIALHRCLLHEHHDFLLASQHPSASPALRRLASKYAMPARMWRHGIHSFLELLRHRLPDSYDHMLAFVYLAYSMMALLYETVPAFEDTWIECLGDLARYRMAIEDEDLEDRKVWAGVGHRWYSIASQRAPTTGRLYHHLAILTREDVLQQLSLFSKSLCVSVPLSHARTSILALLDPVLAGKSIHLCLDIQLSAFDLAFVKTHGLLFSQELDLFEAQSQEFFASINSYIDRIADKFLQDGYHIAIANSAAMLGYGSSDNPLMCDMKDRIENFASFPEHDPCDLQFEAARQMAHATLKALLLRMHDPNVLAGIHASLVFMHDMVSHPWTAHLVQIDFPWASLADFVNNLLRNYDTSFGTIDREDFPIPKATGTHPFPEDIAMRGLLWAETYFPDGWFPDDKEDKPETASTPLMTAQRKERILWLAARIARKLPSCLKYEPASFNPVCAEFNEPRFSTPRNLYSSDQTWDKTGIFETFSHVSESSSSPFMEILGSVASRSRNDDSSLDGIQATLGLPVDPLGQHPEDIGSPYQPSSGSSTPPIKDYHETLDSWLSDLINLDMVLDENFEHREAQEAEPTHLNAGVGNVIPDICSTFPVDVIVFSQTGDGQHPDDEEHPDGNSEPDQNLERDRDEDHERQDMGEAEKPRILKSTAEPKTYDLTSPLLGGKEYPRVEPNPFLIDCPRPHEILEAKVPSPQLPSPSSSSSSPGKPHACYHCNKAFSRASDMNKHIKYHTRPITCPVQGCDYTCGRQKDLSRHQHGVHKDMFGEEEFPCPFEECKKAGVKFSRRDNLGRHLKRRHGGATGEGDQRKVRGMSEC
ncbi:hypothetical protein DL98DRAFT_484051 [Cadophora sp. DSE1049]|nr:hypothetical protein DL98DRAFT_484051 [Cadophora sp. DSE1049]